MNKNNLPMFIGVFVSVLAILFLNDLFVVDSCVDAGGTFNYDNGSCLLASGETKDAKPSNILIGAYFVLAITIAVSVSLCIRKFFNIKQ